MGYFDDLWPNTQAPRMDVRLGGSIYSDGKLVTGVVGTAYNRLLLPTDLMQVSGQGATPEQILINAWGACGTATGESLTVATPYFGSQTNDSYGLAIPSAPQPHDSIRVRRDSLTNSRVITHKITKQKRQSFLQDIRPLDGIIIKHYGTYSFVDANGVTHQPPGKRDPVVQLPGVGANIDNDTIKFDANGKMYADLFGSGAADGSGASATTVGGVAAGHGIELIPGFVPTAGPDCVVEAGGSVPAGSYTYMYVWIIEGKRTPQSPSISCKTIDATVGPPSTPAYHQPHLTIPGKPDIVHATNVELYRKDSNTSATGTVQTKFAYTSSPGVLITDGSTGATKITSGAYTGMWQWTATSTTGHVEAGYEWEYNPLIRVKVGSPPIPYDPRDGSLTTLIINGAQDGSSVFKTSDGGALNPLTGAITYPPDNPLNHSGYRLVDTLPAQPDPYDYIDTKADADLGALYVKVATSINVKPARYLVEPYPGMSPITGTTPSLWELSGMGFNSADPLFGNDGLYARTHFGLGINQQNDITPKLAAFAARPAVGAGGQTAVSINCYGGTMYPGSSIGVDGGDDALGMYTKIDGATIKRNANDEMYVAGGGGFVGTGWSGQTFNGTGITAGSTNVFDWVENTSDGTWTIAGTDIAFPVSGTYMVSAGCAWNSGSTPTSGTSSLLIKVNGTIQQGSPTGYANGFRHPPELVALSMVTVTAGDILTLSVNNTTDVTYDYGGDINIWRVF